MTELDYITEAAERFYDEAGFEFGPKEQMKAYYGELIDSGAVFTKVIMGKGFVVGAIVPSFLEPSKKQCQEIAWYVEPEHRGGPTAIKLMRMYEKHAIDNNCNYVTMVALESIDPGKTGYIYKKLGYKKLESHYIKEL